MISTTMFRRVVIRKIPDVRSSERSLTTCGFKFLCALGSSPLSSSSCLPAITCKRQYSVSSFAASNATGGNTATNGVVSFSDINLNDHRMKTEIKKKFLDVRHLHEVAAAAVAVDGEKVWVRGRVDTSRIKGGACFLVLRSDVLDTVQCCSFKDSARKTDSVYQADYASYLQFVQHLPKESLVEVCGTVVPAQVKSCTQRLVEIHIEELRVVARATPLLPFNMHAPQNMAPPPVDQQQHQVVEDDSDEASDGSSSDVVSQAIRLNHRWLDLRNPANNAIMRIQSAVGQLFREHMYAHSFTEIHSPKLVAGASEGGADVFNVQYFDKPACLAQSPQLYKQMALAADMKRVFEVGPVFRAEQSHTRRHLCEFTGLDIEMEISEHYSEVHEVLHGLFKYIFEQLESPRYAREMAAIRAVYPSTAPAITDEPLVLQWQEAMQMLSEAGMPVGPLDDLTGAAELRLGELVKQKYHSDFFILDQYPSRIRPFYTMLSPTDPDYSHSYDLFIRGQEICSGAQRCHDPALLEQQIVAKGLNPEHFKSYLSAFQYGMSPHGGAGIGLERVVFLYLGLDNVRKASLFPRTPRRLTP